MRFILLALALGLAASTQTAAAAGGSDLDRAPTDIANKASLQRGAQLFVNYCMGCHSAQYMRYNRVGQDLRIPDELVERYLIFTGDGITDTMQIAMASDDAEDWFGIKAPDLSLVARARGEDWIYTFLRSFYLDDDTPQGINNLVYENTAMPHALWELQGWQKPVYGDDGDEIVDLELVEEGRMTPSEFDRAAADLTNFLNYVGEPAQLERSRIGMWVLIYLVLLFGVAYLFKREYWKDVH